MVVTDPPPGGGSASDREVVGGLTRPPGISHSSSETTALNDVSDQSTVTPIVMGDSSGDKKEMRSFAQILADEKQKRNILEIKIRKLTGKDQTVVKSLTIEDVSVLLFDVIKVNPSHCLGVALKTSRYDTKEVKLKSDVDASQYLTGNNPILFKDHEVEVKRQTANVTVVTFRNVPFNIPDEEIINLCKCYGEPLNNKVSYEKPSKNSRGVAGSARIVEMNMQAGKQFENFYWMEGPLEGDVGGRVTVLHAGQVQQCSHCLRRADSCPGVGVGKVCEKMGTPRGLIADYMQHLKIQHGYVSLKMRYQQEEFPELQGKAHLSDGFAHMVETEETEAELEKTVANEEDTNELYKELMQTKSKLASAEKKLSFADPELNKVAKLTIAASHLKYDEQKDILTVENEAAFTKLVEEHFKGQSKKPKKIQGLKNKVLAHVKVLERRERGLSVSSSGSDKRLRSNDSQEGSPKSLRLSKPQ